MRNDRLHQGAVIVYQKEGKRRASATTRQKHLLQAIRIVKRLRKLGFSVQKWKNVSNKHVGKLVDSWLSEGITTKSIKNYLSTIRRITTFFGNNSIHKKNSTFGISSPRGKMKKDLSLSKEEYRRITKALALGIKQYDYRFLAMYRLQRHLGLRTEESYKFNPRQSCLPDGKVWICHGTKGGRERALDKITPEAEIAIRFALRVMGKYRNLIPNEPGMTERKWRQKYYNRMAEIGANRKKAGAGGHGNRHFFAQERYKQMTLFAPPCKFRNEKQFMENASKIAGNEWIERDKAARTVIRGLLGHGPYRNDITAQYLGTCKKKNN